MTLTCNLLRFLVRVAERLETVLIVAFVSGLFVLGCEILERLQ